MTQTVEILRPRSPIRIPFRIGKRRRQQITLEHHHRHHFGTRPFCITSEHASRHHFSTPKHVLIYSFYWSPYIRPYLNFWLDMVGLGWGGMLHAGDVTGGRGGVGIHAPTHRRVDVDLCPLVTPLPTLTRSVYTQKLSHGEHITHKSLYTEQLLHPIVFTHSSAYTQTLFCRG